MIVMKVIAGIVGYIIISVIITILFAYTDRKAGETAENVYEDDKFNEYCLVGFLFPLSIFFLLFFYLCFNNFYTHFFYEFYYLFISNYY